MGMSNCACHADTIRIDFVKEQCPKEWEDFNSALSDDDMSFDHFCILKIGEDELDEAIEDTYDALCEAFNKVTGLELGVVHHEAQDRGDELDGGSFSVERVYQYTPAGEKYKKSIERKFWTTFG